MVGISLAVVGLVFAIVQGGLIRIIIPKLGQERSVYVGLSFSALGFILFALATESWMMFAFTVVYCLGGIAGPALQGIISTQVPANEQGELQGALTSLMSVTSIIGPPLMTNTFSYFTNSHAPCLPARSTHDIGGSIDDHGYPMGTDKPEEDDGQGAYVKCITVNFPLEQ